MMLRRALTGILLGSLLACEPITTITVRSDAPPGRTARVDLLEQRILLSPDIAVAIECTYYDPLAVDEPVSRACDGFEATPTEAGIVEVLPAYLDGTILAGPAEGVAAPGVDPDGRDRAAAVLLGRAAGATGLELAHADASVHFTVAVEDPGH